MLLEKMNILFIPFLLELKKFNLCNKEYAGKKTSRICIQLNNTNNFEFTTSGGLLMFDCEEGNVTILNNTFPTLFRFRWTNKHKSSGYWSRY